MQEQSTVETPTTAMVKNSKAKSDTKKAAAAKAETDTVKQDDVIATEATSIESLSKEKAFELVAKLAENVEFTYFKLGGILSLISRQQWFHEEGYDTFKDFVEAKFGIHYRKAMYLIGIYNGLVESGVPWEKVSSLGWSKLKELAHILTPENVDKWVEIAKSLSVIALIEYIKQETAAQPSTTEVTPKPDLSTLSFKVHSDQKETIREAIEKAKHESGTEFDSAALEFMAVGYLSGPSKKGAVVQKSLEQLIKETSIEEVLGLIEKIHPGIDITVEVPE